MKVFLAYEGNYDDRGVVAVCSSHELALAGLVKRLVKRNAHRKHLRLDPVELDMRALEADVEPYELDLVPEWVP